MNGRTWNARRYPVKLDLFCFCPARQMGGRTRGLPFVTYRSHGALLLCATGPIARIPRNGASSPVLSTSSSFSAPVRTRKPGPRSSKPASRTFTRHPTSSGSAPSFYKAEPRTLQSLPGRRETQHLIFRPQPFRFEAQPGISAAQPGAFMAGLGGSARGPMIFPSLSFSCARRSGSAQARPTGRMTELCRVEAYRSPGASRIALAFCATTSARTRQSRPTAVAASSIK